VNDEKEALGKEVAVRTRSGEQLAPMTLERLITFLDEEDKNRR